MLMYCILPLQGMALLVKFNLGSVIRFVGRRQVLWNLIRGSRTDLLDRCNYGVFQSDKVVSPHLAPTGQYYITILLLVL